MLISALEPQDHVAAASNLPPIDRLTPRSPSATHIPFLTPLPPPPAFSLNMWPVLSGAASASPRTDILFTNTALLHGDWKLLTGKQVCPAAHQFNFLPPPLHPPFSHPR